MSIICSICRKKQSGWIADYPLSKEHENQRVCHACYLSLQSIESNTQKQDVDDAVSYLSTYLSTEMTPEAKAVLNSALKKPLERQAEAERLKQAELRRQKEEHEQKELARIEKEEALRQNREQQYQLRLSNLKKSGATGYYEYKAISLQDEGGLFRRNSGKVDTVAMTAVLNNLGLDGWHLVTAYSNELGKNALSGGAGGAMLGVNSTVDENILIFERFIKF